MVACGHSRSGWQAPWGSRSEGCLGSPDSLHMELGLVLAGRHTGRQLHRHRLHHWWMMNGHMLAGSQLVIQSGLACQAKVTRTQGARAAFPGWQLSRSCKCTAHSIALPERSSTLLLHNLAHSCPQALLLRPMIQVESPHLQRKQLQQCRGMSQAPWLSYAADPCKLLVLVQRTSDVCWTSQLIHLIQDCEPC